MCYLRRLPEPMDWRRLLLKILDWHSRHPFLVSLAILASGLALLFAGMLLLPVFHGILGSPLDLIPLMPSMPFIYLGVVASSEAIQKATIFRNRKDIRMPKTEAIMARLRKMAGG
ncbi:hypothetical protein [Poseidonocella sp. HB161398]|uniref:hypothetical protein n=1 Tax=Poseidonocella sp. HB161398 TaxID=2320855 RepID=UPI0011083353|nr:hypothetical protein [Poseidonocella sp. HB161398]